MPTKIMLIRHAEKPSDAPPPHGVTPHGTHDAKALSVRGWTRAGALAMLLAPTGGTFQEPRLESPNWVFAMGIGKGSESSRPQDTVAPLLDKLGKSARSNFLFIKEQEKDMIAAVLDREGVVLVCWEHDKLAIAAQHIPMSAENTTPLPKEWDKERFDLIWVFDERADGYVFAEVLQRALGGDEGVQGRSGQSG